MPATSPAKPPPTRTRGRVVAGGYAGFNRRELLATTAEWVNIDHRRGAAFAPGDMISYIQAAWDDSPDTKIYIAAVHRLSKIGAVVTHVAHGISQEGFDAEWRDVHVLAVEGDMFSRSELFDEADLDTAIATVRRAQPAGTAVGKHGKPGVRALVEHFAARDWDAIRPWWPTTSSIDDRRRVVNGGVRHGRDAGIARLASGRRRRRRDKHGVTSLRPAASVSLSRRVRASGRDPGAFQDDVLQVVEIDADERIAGVSSSTSTTLTLPSPNSTPATSPAKPQPTRAHGRSSRRVTPQFNRSELPATTTDWVDVDHRPGDRDRRRGHGGISSRQDRTRHHDITTSCRDVHRLNSVRAVVTYAAQETSREGFDAEWRGVTLLDGRRRPGQPQRGIRRGGPRRRDRAIRPAEPAGAAAGEHGKPGRRALLACVNARDWDTMASILADDYSSDDRRRVTGAGVATRSGCRDREHAGVADLGVVTATLRSSRLAANASFSLSTHAAIDQKQQISSPRRSSGSRLDLDGRIARRSSCSTSTTSTLPSPNSTLVTSPAKRPPTRARGRSSREPRRAQPARTPRRLHRTA